MQVPLMNLGLQYEQLKDRIDKEMKEIARTSSFILGRETEEFEKGICEYCNVKHAIGVASGTDALILTLAALNVGRGDEVITTPFTFIATAEAISRVGAKPVFVDIDRYTYNIDPAKIEAAITSNTKAIIPVHLYGNPCDMENILRIAKENKLDVIEDAAQAIGATYRSHKIGSFGAAGCISFYPGKNLGAFGDGGMILTNNKDVAEKARILRNHGSSSRYYHSVIGFNSRLDNLQAEILSIKLTELDNWTKARRRIASRYNSELKDVVIVPKEQENSSHVYHLYVIRVKNEKRDALLNFLNENGIESRVYYPLPLHMQECYKELGYKEGYFPEAEAAARETLAVPLFPELSSNQQRYVIENVKRCLK